MARSNNKQRWIFQNKHTTKRNRIFEGCGNKKWLCSWRCNNKIHTKKDAYRKIKQIRNDGSLSDEEKERRIANLVKQVKDATAAEAIVAKTPALKWAISPVAILKHLLKALGIALFIWGLASLTLPFAKLIALVAAFIGYFYIGGTKEPEEEK